MSSIIQLYKTSQGEIMCICNCKFIMFTGLICISISSCMHYNHQYHSYDESGQSLSNITNYSIGGVIEDW